MRLKSSISFMLVILLSITLILPMSVFAEPKKIEEVVIVCPNNEYPFSYLDRSGQAHGFVIDFLTDWAKTKRLEPRFVLVDDEYAQEIYKNIGDILFMPSVKGEASNLFETRPIMVLDNVVMVRNSKNFQIAFSDMSEFLKNKDLNIGTKDISFRINRIQEQFGQSLELIPYRNNNQGLEDLENGLLDVFILPDQQSIVLMNEHRYRNFSVHQSLELTEPYTFFCRTKDMQFELDREITGFLRSPKYKSSYEKYFKNDDIVTFMKTNSLFVFNVMILIVLIGLISLTYIFYKNNKHQFDLKNKELNKQIEKNTTLLNTVLSHEKTLNDYYVNLSHEFRTPLNMILSASQMNDMIMKKSHISTSLNYNKTIEYNVYRMLKLINNISDLKRLDDGRMQIHQDVVDALYVLENFVENLKQISPDKATIELKASEPEYLVTMDHTLFIRIIANLVSNAFKHGQPIHTTRAAVVIELDLQDDRFIISIEDHGRGIPESFNQYLFNAYSKPKDDNFNDNEGAGLGLAIVKKLAALMDGEIEIVSRPLVNGTRCVLSLPVSGAHQSEKTANLNMAAFQEYPIQIEFADVWLKEV